MAEKLEVKELAEVAVRFSGDSGDGMQLAGNIYSRQWVTSSFVFSGGCMDVGI